MATYTVGGYFGLDFLIEGGGSPSVGSRFMLDPAFVASTDAISITITDDDTRFDGASGVALDGNQTAVVETAGGSTLASGPVRLGFSTTVTNPAGGTITLWELRVNGSVVGYVANGEIEPGVTYQIDNWTDTTAGTGPDFSTLATPLHDPALGETITGGVYNDSIAAGSGNDSVTGGTGNDTVNLGDGNDTFGGGTDAGADILYGGTGNDSLNGGADNDQIWGEAGDDTLTGGTGDDNLNGGADNDSFFISDQDGYDNVDGGTEYDHIWLSSIGSAQGVVVTFNGTDSGNYAFVGTTANGVFNNLEAITGTQYADTLTAANDTNGVFLAGGGGNDTITGGSGNDTLSGGTGNDTVTGGGGADTFLIGWNDGVDSLSGGETGLDSDFLSFDATGGSGGVSVTLSGAEAGSYSFAGGGSGSFTQIESLYGSALGDTLDAATVTGSVTINGGAGSDSLTGGSGADLLVGGADNDTVSGGAGNDTLDGGDGNDLLQGGLGDDQITGVLGEDTLSGGDGNDYLNALSGANLLDGGTGADSIIGGTDNDTLIGGDGDDTLTTGDGADVISLGLGGGTDTVTDFNLSEIDKRTIDRLDTSALQGGSWNGVVVARDVTVEDDGSGNASLLFPGGEKLVLQGYAPSQIDQSTLRAMGIPCFVAGTLIDTPDGPRPVEALGVGDRVTTRDGGTQPVLWRAARQVGHDELAQTPALRPVEIRAGALGNARPLRVSGQHAVLLATPLGERLVRALHLAAAAPHLARVMVGRRQVRYHHLLLPAHALLRADGVWSESLWPGPMTLAALSPADRGRLFGACPALAPGLLGLAPVEAAYGPRIRPLLRRRDVGPALACRVTPAA